MTWSTSIRIWSWKPILLPRWTADTCTFPLSLHPNFIHRDLLYHPLHLHPGISPHAISPEVNPNASLLTTSLDGNVEQAQVYSIYYSSTSTLTLGRGERGGLVRLVVVA